MDKVEGMFEFCVWSGGGSEGGPCGRRGGPEGCTHRRFSLRYDRQSEFHELALTGRYCRVHLASVQFGRGYEAIDLPYTGSV